MPSELRNRNSNQNDLNREIDPQQLNNLNLDEEDFIFLSFLNNLNWRSTFTLFYNFMTLINTLNSDTNNQNITNQQASNDENENNEPRRFIYRENSIDQLIETNQTQDNRIVESYTFSINRFNRFNLIRFMFMKIAMLYFSSFSYRTRKFFEYSLFLSSILCFILLVYLHTLFIKNPTLCLQNVKESWDGDGILRVIILDDNEEILKNLTENALTKDLDKSLKEFELFSEQIRPSNMHVVEFSIEHGFLKLNSEIRSKLNISVTTVTLYPNKDECFGDSLSKFMLKYFLGYDVILFNSLKALAEKQNLKGYIRNLVTGKYYRFINISMTRLSYLPAAIVMLLFTSTISMLIRYSQHQIMMFFMQVFNIIQNNASDNFCFVQIIIVILALIGMQAIMAEFFNDAMIASNIILIVWVADIFDWVCCNTFIAKRNWSKFFFLYHFVFYAYIYRFNGQYSNLALLTSCLFTAHSMLYFMHKYERPYIIPFFH